MWAHFSLLFFTVLSQPCRIRSHIHMLSTLLLPPVELHSREQQIQIGLAAVKPLYMEWTWRTLKSTKKHGWDVPSGQSYPQKWDAVGIQMNWIPRETQKRLLPQTNQEMSHHFFFSFHLPTVCLSCCALTLLCLLARCWRTWLAPLTPSWQETFSFLGEKDTGTAWQPSVTPGARHSQNDTVKLIQSPDHIGTALQGL